MSELVITCDGAVSHVSGSILCSGTVNTYTTDQFIEHLFLDNPVLVNQEYLALLGVDSASITYALGFGFGIIILAWFFGFGIGVAKKVISQA